ncbi:MAG: copper chaperone PCu(A)C [Candidatus Rokubacteria bacterium]|nr:copper chaperone PCu(A)C [Candidatus Rokubacteria bacterium]MBI3826960.1 copper chaperone PCu(A)C [Candidatus Rokubacteria bacterium]
MTRRPGAAPALLVAAALAAALAGCVHYPAVEDIGGVRIRPQNARIVRQGAQATLYVDLSSTGKFGDLLVAAQSPVSRAVLVVPPGTAPAPDDVDTKGLGPTLWVPGKSVVSLRPNGPRVDLADFTRPLAPGETVIVLLIFQKSGPIGAVAAVE